MALWPGTVSEPILSRFDLVGFDPRGTGRSAVSDENDPPGQADLLTEPGFAATASEVQQSVPSCVEQLGDRDSLFHNEATARDLDMLRQALEDAKLTYAGYSYGARLGGDCAHLFPDHLRAAVLDAPPDPLAEPIDVVARRSRVSRHCSRTTRPAARAGRHLGTVDQLLDLYLENLDVGRSTHRMCTDYLRKRVLAGVDAHAQAPLGSASTAPRRLGPGHDDRAGPHSGAVARRANLPA